MKTKSFNGFVSKYGFDGHSEPLFLNHIDEEHKDMYFRAQLTIEVPDVPKEFTKEQVQSKIFDALHSTEMHIHNPTIKDYFDHLLIMMFPELD